MKGKAMAPHSSVVSSSSLLSMFLIFTLLQSSLLKATEKKTYIVYMGTHSHGLNPSSDALEMATKFHHSLLGSYLGSEEKAKDAIIYSYNRHINGFAAILDEVEATEIRKHRDVISVFLSKKVKPATTRSWKFLGLERDNEVVPSQSIWKKARFGEDVIIGNLDSGVWPESKSFSEYEGIGPIPSKWRGSCQPTIGDKIHCNRKLIGVKYFSKGILTLLKMSNASIPKENFFTSRDTDGHGTHTLSTAGGSFVPRANILGFGNGTAKGGSPKARVAAYKVLWPTGDGADTLAAFEAAIADGVDVLSLSLVFPASDFLDNPISIGSFHAIMNNIVVVAGAGNDGPDPKTVNNVSPWMLTVAASTIDREFNSYVTLGNKKKLKGASLSSSSLPSQKFYPLINGADAKVAEVNPLKATFCRPNSLDPNKVKGKILICVAGDEISPSNKSHQAHLAGAVGMILINHILINDTEAETYVLPTSHLNATEGTFVYEYLNTTKNPIAYISPAKTEVRVKPSPIMASFSSRGPNPIEPALLKPDITAPGVNILAAFTEAVGPTKLTFDKRRVPFNIISGTSMACPHVSGIAGLLKTLHPDWSPAAIHSAIMTTARVQDSNKGPLLDWNKKKASPFEYGSGHVQPNRAMDPGLVYDRTIEDYVDFLCAHGIDETLLEKFTKKPYNKCPTSFNLANFNYPSIVVNNLSSQSVIITRKVKNVGSPGTYKAYVRAPNGVSIYVKPTSLKFSKIGEEKKFEIILKPKVVGKPKNYVFGQLKWSDGKHYVRSPIVVKY
ncbi:subtilisin-like protease SBT5.4 [Humulus lupulus]|uniref:subtilisin-like protease SBT5.4 n=1 Tax=Humulus lupulus TaxID=3486 RepID=UPI002B413D95|nr:subtilisin-like protease SBT5.4 [Humulus lupulus]XP_062079217.1 subtilisin-like protease SBT5.4 [Humulus lupulus]